MRDLCKCGKEGVFYIAAPISGKTPVCGVGCAEERVSTENDEIDRAAFEMMSVQSTLGG